MNGKRLTSLQSKDPVGLPAAQKTVDDPPAVCHEALSGSDWQFINATEMENLGDIEVAKTVVSLDAETGEQSGTIRERRFVQHIRGVRAALGPSEVGENLQAGAEVALIVELKRVIVTIPSKARKDEAGGEARIG